jgi:hypothetical protein
MKCGNCKGNHETTSEVKECYGCPSPRASAFQPQAGQGRDSERASADDDEALTTAGASSSGHEHQ